MERGDWGGKYFNSSNSNMAANETRTRRLYRELQQLRTNPLTGINVNEESLSATLETLIIDLEGASGTLYEEEKFQLQFTFPPKYPFESPQVIFVGSHIPVHPHIYTNGHICLSILTDDWSPALSVQSVCLSVISMMSSCTEKKLPPDNEFYIRTCSKNPKKTKWWYHDDKV